MPAQHQPIAKIELLIRRPVPVVYDAFVNPDVITKIWFNRSSGPLAQGATVTWYWDLYDASTRVRVLELDENRRIYIEWDIDSDQPSNVEWKFEARADQGTYVSIVNSGFDADDAEVTNKVADSAGGFALVLAAAKAYLEHGVELNIVADRF